jgi:hypothetical protein
MFLNCIKHQSIHPIEIRPTQQSRKSSSDDSTASTRTIMDHILLNNATMQNIVNVICAKIRKGEVLSIEDMNMIALELDNNSIIDIIETFSAGKHPIRPFTQTSFMMGDVILNKHMIFHRIRHKEQLSDNNKMFIRMCKKRDLLQIVRFYNEKNQMN